MYWIWANTKTCTGVENGIFQQGRVTLGADNTNLATTQEGLSYQNIIYRHVAFQKSQVTCATSWYSKITNVPWTMYAKHQGDKPLLSSHSQPLELKVRPSLLMAWSKHLIVLMVLAWSIYHLWLRVIQHLKSLFPLVLHLLIVRKEFEIGCSYRTNVMSTK